MLTSTLGKTERLVSRLGFGGIVVMNETAEDARAYVAEAIEEGVTYFDVAPTYQNAQERLGPALESYRGGVFLACKTGCRDKASAQKELEQSLKTLRTDHLDLYQLHGLIDIEQDVHAALGKGGALETFIEAKRQGKILHIGFSAHNPDAALTAMREFDFDTCMFPVNFACHYHNEFEIAVLKHAKKHRLGIIGIKALAQGKWTEDGQRQHYPKTWYEPITTPPEAAAAVHWALDQGVDVLLPPGDIRLWRLALQAIKEQPLPRDIQEQRLIALAERQEPIFDPCKC